MIELMINHFKLYNDLINKIYGKNMELIKMKEDWYNVSGTNYDSIKVKGGSPPDIANQLHNIIEKEKELSATINYKDELRRVHEKEIDKLNDVKRRTILKLYYLDHCSLKQIAYCLKMSESHIKKLKAKSIDEFINKNIKM